jgi:hypothetical protein
MIVRRTLALAALSLLPLAGCEAADPTVVNTTPSGEVHFDYAGHSEGAFHAEGQVNRRNTSHGTWAAGQRTLNARGETVLGVISQIERADGKLDQIFIAVLNPAVGEIECEPAGVELCNFDALFAIGFDLNTERAEQVYITRGGTLRITSMTNGRVQGEFLLQLEEADPADDTAVGEVEVSAGTFDVPLLN